MVEGYRFLQHSYLKQARGCVDSFHIIQMINTMFNNQLKEIMKSFNRDSIEYYLLKKKRFILLKNGCSIDWLSHEYNRKLGYTLYLLRYRELLFNINPLIKEIYDLKESYIAFNRLKDKELITDQFDLIISRFYSHSNK